VELETFYLNADSSQCGYPICCPGEQPHFKLPRFSSKTLRDSGIQAELEQLFASADEIYYDTGMPMFPCICHHFCLPFSPICAAAYCTAKRKSGLADLVEAFNRDVAMPKGLFVEWNDDWFQFMKIGTADADEYYHRRRMRMMHDMNMMHDRHDVGPHHNIGHYGHHGMHSVHGIHDFMDDHHHHHHHMHHGAYNQGPARPHDILKPGLRLMMNLEARRDYCGKRGLPFVMPGQEATQAEQSPLPPSPSAPTYVGAAQTPYPPEAPPPYASTGVWAAPRPGSDGVIKRPPSRGRYDNDL